MPTIADQQAYDNALAAINKLTGLPRIKAKEALEARYPDGRPVVDGGANNTLTGGGNTETSGELTAIAFGITKELTDKFPELFEVYKLFLAKDYTEAKLKYYASNYYKNLTDAAKTRQQLKATAKGQYDQLLDSYRKEQRNRLVNKGINIDDATFMDLTEKAYDKGLDDNQLDASILNSGKLGKIGGSTLGAVSNLKQFASSFGVSNLFLKPYWDKKSEDLLAGKITQEDIEDEIKNTAASAFPAYADSIKNGTSIDALASAYKTAYATILEVDPDSVTYDNPRLRQAMQFIGPDGKPSVKPLWQFEKELRSTDEWKYTDNARDTFDSLSLKVLRDWGLA
jgi:hypothetical protein